MAPDDDYWPEQHARRDEDRVVKDTTERESRLTKALKEKNFTGAEWTVGLSPGASRAVPRRPETPAAEFRRHKERLEFLVERAGDFLPQVVREVWTEQIKPLDLEWPDEALASIERIGVHHQLVLDNNKPPATVWDRRPQWEAYLLRIGEEIDWLTARLRDVKGT